MIEFALRVTYKKDGSQRRTCRIFRHLVIVTYVLPSLIAGGIAAFASQWVPPVTASPRYIVDERGHQVGLPYTVKTQAVFMAIGVGEYLLVTRHPGGIITSSVETNKLIKKNSLLDRAFRDLTQMRMLLSVVEPGAMNFETLLFYKPDIMVTWARMAEDFERIGLSVVGLGPVGSTERLAQNTSLFSAIFSEPQRSSTLIGNSLADRQKIAESVALRTTRKPRLLYLLKAGDRQWRVRHGFSDIIDEAGGAYIGQDLDHGSLNTEELLILAPDVIVLMGSNWADTKAPEELVETPSLTPIPAVKNRRVYNAPPGVSGYMSTVIELPLYTRWLAEILHPDELDRRVRQLAKEIYKAELGVEPDEDEIDDALAVKANTHSAYSSIFMRAAD